VELQYDISVAVDGKRLANMELQALIAVQKAGSQNRAAAELGISVPVLHNYIRKAERKLGFKLVSSTPTATRLTPQAGALLDGYRRRSRPFEPRQPSVGLTPISRLYVERFLPGIRLYEGDDAGLQLLFDAGIVDAALFDDPRMASSRPAGARAFQFGEDSLQHVDLGRHYAWLRYGAQRLGFELLEARRQPYLIMATFEEPEQLLSSGCSYFISERLAEARELRVEQARGSRSIRHPLIGLVSGRRGIARLLGEMLGVGELPSPEHRGAAGPGAFGGDGRADYYPKR